MSDFADIPLQKIIKSRDIQLYYNNIFKIHWVMSYFCNYNCSYCWPDSKHKIKETRSEDQFVSAVRRLMREVQQRNYSSYQVTLSGGEPSAHPHIIPVLKEFAKYKTDTNVLNLSLISNLSRSYAWLDKFIEAVSSYNKIVVVASFHHEFANLEEFANKAKYLIERNISVVVNITFAVEMFNEYHEAARYLQDAGLIVKALPQRSTNSRDYTQDELNILQQNFTFKNAVYPPQRNKNPVDYVSNKMVNDLGYAMELIDSDNKKYYVDYPERFPSLGFVNFKDWICYSGYESVCIDADGTTKRGRAGCWNEYIGNIFDSSSQILFDNPKTCSREYCSAATDSVTQKIKPHEIPSRNIFRIAQI
jgi:organic radical activating enzyme